MVGAFCPGSAPALSTGRELPVSAQQGWLWGNTPQVKEPLKSPPDASGSSLGA